jgi:hypothetical protein
MAQTATAANFEVRTTDFVLRFSKDGEPFEKPLVVLVDRANHDCVYAVAWDCIRHVIDGIQKPDAGNVDLNSTTALRRFLKHVTEGRNDHDGLSVGRDLWQRVKALTRHTGGATAKMHRVADIVNGVQHTFPSYVREDRVEQASERLVAWQAAITRVWDEMHPTPVREVHIIVD